MLNREQFLQAFRDHGHPLVFTLPGDVHASIGQTPVGKWRMVYEEDPREHVEGMVMEADTAEELAFAILLHALGLSAPWYEGQYERWKEHMSRDPSP